MLAPAAGFARRELLCGFLLGTGVVLAIVYFPEQRRTVPARLENLGSSECMSDLTPSVRVNASVARPSHGPLPAPVTPASYLTDADDTFVLGGEPSSTPNRLAAPAGPAIQSRPKMDFPSDESITRDAATEREPSAAASDVTLAPPENRSCDTDSTFPALPPPLVGAHVQDSTLHTPPLVLPDNHGVSTGNSAPNFTDSGRALANAGGDRQSRRFDLRDRQSGASVATVRVLSSIDSAYESPVPPAVPQENIVASAAAFESANTLLANSLYVPYLKIDGTNLKDFVRIETRNLELSQLVSEFAKQFAVAISVQGTLSGTVSARVSGGDGIETLAMLLQPFGYQLHQGDSGNWIIDATHPRTRLTSHGPSQDAEVPPNHDPEGSENTSSVVIQLRNERDATPELPSRRDSSRVVHVNFVENEPQSLSRPAPTASKSIALPANRVRPSGQAVTPPPNSELPTTLSGEVQTATCCTIDDLIAKAIEEPQNASILTALAARYLQQGDHPAALGAAERALALNRENSVANQMMGQILLASGQDRRGRHYLEQARFLQSRR